MLLLLPIEDGRLKLTDDLLEAGIWLRLLLLLCLLKDAIDDLLIRSVQPLIGNLSYHWNKHVVPHFRVDYLYVEEQLVENAESTACCDLYLRILWEVKQPKERAHDTN